MLGLKSHFPSVLWFNQAPESLHPTWIQMLPMITNTAIWTLQFTLLVNAVRKRICMHNMARLFPLNPVLQLFCFFHMAPGWACYREMQSLRLTWRSVTWGLQTGQLWLDQVLGELVHFGRKETVVFLSRALGLCWGSCTKLHYSGISPCACFNAMAFYTYSKYMSIHISLISPTKFSRSTGISTISIPPTWLFSFICELSQN